MDAQRRIVELEAALSVTGADRDAERARNERLELQIGALLEQVTAPTQKVAELTERLGQNSRTRTCRRRAIRQVRAPRAVAASAPRAINGMFALVARIRAARLDHEAALLIVLDLIGSGMRKAPHLIPGATDDFKRHLQTVIERARRPVEVPSAR